MARQTYSQTYNQLKTAERQRMNEAIGRLKHENPQRFTELQELALHELEHPPERPVIRLRPLSSLAPYTTFNIDDYLKQSRGDKKDIYVTTTDRWGSTHTYFESVPPPHTIQDATKVLEQRHPCFTEREEKVTKMEACVCPLCQ